MKLGDKVKILKNRKTSGKYNYGQIVGVEQTDGNFLGAFNEEVFLARFTRTPVRYKVAFIDCFTDRACTEWFWREDILIGWHGKNGITKDTTRRTYARRDMRSQNGVLRNDSGYYKHMISEKLYNDLSSEERSKFKRV